VSSLINAHNYTSKTEDSWVLLKNITKRFQHSDLICATIHFANHHKSKKLLKMCPSIYLYDIVILFLPNAVNL